MRDILPIIKDIASIVAILISAASLFVYTQRDKKSFLRVNANSYKLSFSIDLENVGPNLAYIKAINLLRRDSPEKLTAVFTEEALPLAKILGVIDESHCTARLYSNLTGDVIKGGGTKHHLFRCTVTDLEELKKIWKVLSQYELEVAYQDVFGLLTKKRRTCRSHFDRDYESFQAALGNRACFVEEQEKS